MTYKATQWEPAEAKEKFEKQFKKFVKDDFLSQSFPKWFYQCLSNCFGMIAHYNQEGFYGTFFEDLPGKIRFIRAVLQYPCYGDPAYTYSDVEKVLQAWLKEERILEKLQVWREMDFAERERAEYERLKAKYESQSQAS